MQKVAYMLCLQTKCKQSKHWEHRKQVLKETLVHQAETKVWYEKQYMTIWDEKMVKKKTV